VGLCQSVLAQTGLGVGSDRHQRAHSSSCAVTMAWISANWRYILSSLSVVSRGEVLRGLAVAASVWPPSQLAEGATSLARGWVELKSTIRILSTSSVGPCCGDMCGWTKHRLAIVAPPDKRAIAQRRHRCSTMAPPSVVGPSSWLE
jgi:hypothetical protein